MIVLDDANLDLAIEGGLWGAFGTTGQRCTATSRIIVQKGVYREFVDRYVARAKALKVGNGLDESIDMGPAVNEAQLKTDLSYVDIGKRRRREAGVRRQPPRQGRLPVRLLHGTDGVRRCRSEDAHRAGRNLRPGGFDHSVRRARRRHRDRQRHRVRLVVGALHART